MTSQKFQVNIFQLEHIVNIRLERIDISRKQNSNWIEMRKTDTLILYEVFYFKLIILIYFYNKFKKNLNFFPRITHFTCSNILSHMLGTPKPFLASSLIHIYVYLSMQYIHIYTMETCTLEIVVSMCCSWHQIYIICGAKGIFFIVV